MSICLSEASLRGGNDEKIISGIRGVYLSLVFELYESEAIRRNRHDAVGAQGPLQRNANPNDIINRF